MRVFVLLLSVFLLFNVGIAEAQTGTQQLTPEQQRMLERLPAGQRAEVLRQLRQARETLPRREEPREPPAPMEPVAPLDEHPGLGQSVRLSVDATRTAGLRERRTYHSSSGPASASAARPAGAASLTRPPHRAW
jgi:hypothetical protein